MQFRLRSEPWPINYSDLYADFLEGSYDCVDRIVLNAYFGMGQTPGGFSRFDAHGWRFSRRLRAWAKANGIPVIYCSPGEDQHKMGEEHLTTHEMNPGRFLVLAPKRQHWFGRPSRPARANSASWCPKILGPTSIIIPFISWTQTEDM
jgi:hypothetical protein